MQTERPKQGIDVLIERSEQPMLFLAAVAVVIYLMELKGVWIGLGIEQPYLYGALAIDVLFVIDLLVKVAVQGRTYIMGPWFLIDFFSSLPILAHLTMVPLRGLRFVRTFRLFRVLRALRALRVLRTLRVLDTELGGPSSDLEAREQSRLDRALSVIVLGYVAFFVGVTAGGQTSNSDEFWLVLGSVVGMCVMLVVVRFLLPTIAARQVRGLLNVALPHQVAAHFLEDPDSYDRTVSGPATIIFCDIAGFTTAVETLGDDTDTLKKHLEAAMDAIVEAHIEQDMIVDKFIGDAVMSFRGGEHVNGTAEEHAARVVLGALAGARALREQNNPMFKSVKTGGASAVDALIGTFGTQRRLAYTILGDRVNLAARLEGACSKVGANNLFCARTKQLTEGVKQITWRRIGYLSVTGKQEHIEAFEAYEAGVDVSWVGDFEAAVSLFESSDFKRALAAFEAVDAKRTHGDGPSRTYIAACRQFMTEGTSEDWRPVLVTRK